MKADYQKLEQTIQRVVSAVKPIADVQTTEGLVQASYVIAEIRHADQQLKAGTNIQEVQERLMSALFNLTSHTQA